MKKFLAFLICVVSTVTFVGCGKSTDEPQMGDYAYTDGDDTYMPTVTLMDDNKFEVSYKGYSQANEFGTYVYDKDNNTLTATVDDGGQLYFEVDGENLIYRAINEETLSVVNKQYDGFDSDVRDQTKFVFQNYDDTEDDTQSE